MAQQEQIDLTSSKTITDDNNAKKMREDEDDDWMEASDLRQMYRDAGD